jgi:hypothetical protein
LFSIRFCSTVRNRFPVSSEEGEWKPPSKSKVYSPRKFKLAKSTSKERIYTEIPPPVAPKPKQKLFRGHIGPSEVAGVAG